MNDNKYAATSSLSRRFDSQRACTVDRDDGLNKSSKPLSTWRSYDRADNRLLSLARSLQFDGEKPSLTHDYDLLRLFERGIHLVEEVAQSSESLFTCESIPRRPLLFTLKTTPLGRRPLHWINDWARLSQELKALLINEFSIEAHPYMRVLLGEAQLSEFSRGETTGSQAEVQGLTDSLNGFVGRLRRVGGSPHVQEEIKKRERHSRDTRRELRGYLQHLGDQHAKLLVLRVDFGYRFDPTRHRIGPRCPPSTVMAHRGQLVAHFKTQFGPQALGYVIKNEFGLYKGPHLHAIFILDGSHVRADIKIAAMLGQHWIQVITAGEGTFYNCNGSKNAYLHVGIGQMDWRNPRDWEGALHMVDYVSKPDYMVRVWAGGAYRTLVKGQKRRRARCKRGRPRSKQYNLNPLDARDLEAPDPSDGRALLPCSQPSI